MPAGDGTYLTVVFNISPMKPCGVQLAMAIRPPGRVTRSNSAAARSGRAANIAPNIVTTESNVPSA